MSMLTFRLELRRSRLVAFWLAVIVLAYGGTIAAMYPILKENSKLLEDYMEILPKELLAAFGMSGTLTDPGVFFSTYIGSFLWPVIAAMGAIVLATRPVAADVDRGWAEVVLGTPLTRTRSLVAAILGQAVVLGALALAAPAGVLAGGAIVGAGFDTVRLLATSVVFFSTLAFAFLDPFFFIGYLMSIALFGLFQAIFMANAGGAWDNAKKVVETELRAKGTDLHAACVVGDTVGDPFKDTSSVALNPIIKFTTLFGLLAVELAVSLTRQQGPMLSTVLSGVFLLISMFFVYRSFYGMRIEGAKE